jgi:hypothetical protein
MIAKLKRVYFEILLVLAGYLLYTCCIKTTNVVIRSDGKGYYDYLPAVFIYKDIHFGFRSNEIEFAEKNLNHDIDSRGYDIRIYPSDHTINKYPCGLSILWMPFFGATHVLTSFVDKNSATGYSMSYQWTIVIAALVYLWMGLLYLRKLLSHYTQNNVLIRLVQVLVLFATNLFLFAYYEPAFSHIYSFSLITIFFYAWIQLAKTGRKKYMYLIGILLALIILVRPFNVLVILFLPFFSGGFNPFINDLKNMFVVQGRHFYLGMLAFFALVSIQPIIWYIQCGQFLPWTYNKETFHFAQPVLFKTLFGFKKGLFIYTPVLLLTAFAFIKLIQQKKTALTFTLGLALIILHYIISSWQTWWYGGSFGLRPYIDFYSVFAVMGIVAFVSVQSSLKAITLVFVSCCLFLNIFQSWQFTHGIISEETMTAKGYTAVFLKTNEKYAGWMQYEGIANEMRQLKVKRTIPVLSHDTLINPGEWKNFEALLSEDKKSENYCFVLDMEVKDYTNPRLFLDYGMPGKIQGYREQTLFQLTGGKRGRQKVHFYFDFHGQRLSRENFRVGFVKLEKPVKIHSIVLQELE